MDQSTKSTEVSESEVTSKVEKQESIYRRVYFH